MKKCIVYVLTPENQIERHNGYEIDEFYSIYKDDTRPINKWIVIRKEFGLSACVGNTKQNAINFLETIKSKVEEAITWDHNIKRQLTFQKLMKGIE